MACPPHSLSPTLSFDHVHRVPTTGRAGGSSHLIRHRHRSHESCEEVLVHPTSRGQFFGTASTILTMIYASSSSAMRRPGFTCSKGPMLSQEDYVELGSFCADSCKALERGTGGKTLDGLNKSARDAIDRLMTWVEPVIYVSRVLRPTVMLWTIGLSQK